MGLKDRTRKLEQRAYGGPEPPCPECGGRIIFEEIAEDGTVTYPEGEPCPACDSWPPDGRIGRIIVDLRSREDRPDAGERGFTLKLDGPPGEDLSEWPP